MNSLFDKDDDKDYLAELTGPGGKFDKTKYASEVEMYQAIAKGKVHGDRLLDLKLQQFDELKEDHTKTLDDYKKIRDENVAKASFEEYLTRMTQKKEEPVNQPLTGNEQPIDLKRIEELATSRAIAAVMELENKKTEAQALQSIENRLKERYGDNAKTVLRDKMNTLNLSEDDIKLLAKKSPEAVINALGLNYQPDPYQNSLPRSNTRSDSFKPVTEIRDAVFYEKLRREKPKEYFSERMSVQRLKDMDHPDFLKRYQERPAF